VGGRNDRRPGGRENPPSEPGQEARRACSEGDLVGVERLRRDRLFDEVRRVDLALRRLEALRAAGRGVSGAGAGRRFGWISEAVTMSSRMLFVSPSLR
jgi:hypothetical protein